MLTQKWAEHIVRTDFKAFDSEMVEQAKNRILDIVGCIVAGADASGNSMLLDLIRGWGGKEEATILVHGIKVPAHNAAWLNAIMARSFDFGNISPYIGDKMAPGHISESTIPTAITAAEWKHASGKELITALILGEDLIIRLIAASKYLPGMGWDSPGIVNKFGTVVIAARLMGLNENQIINALGIVLDQLAGSFQSINDGAHNFKLGQGLAARDGVISAEMAEKGWVGAKDPLLGKYGYFKLYCQGCDPEILTSNLGKEFYGSRCTYKPYPGCGFTHPVIDCALDLVSKNKIKAEDIEEITVSVAPMHIEGSLDKPFIFGEFPQGNALFSYRYAVCNALLRKNSLPEHYTEAFIHDPAVVTLISRVKVLPINGPCNIDSAELKIRMNDGKELLARAPKTKGNPTYKPFTREEILDKFWANINFSKTISTGKAKAALELINSLEEIEDTARLVQLLVK